MSQTSTDPIRAVVVAPPGRRPLIRRWQVRYALGLLVGDCLAALVAVVLALSFGPDDGYSMASRELMWLAVPAWVALLGTGRAYDSSLLGVDTEELRRVVRAGVRGLALVAVIGLGFKLALPRSLVALVVPGTVLLTIAQRTYARHCLRRARLRGEAQHGVVVVGRPESALDLVLRLREQPDAAFSIKHVCSSQQVAVEDILAAVRECGADTVAIASDSGLSSQELRRLGWELEGSDVDLIVSTDLVEVAGPRIHLRPMAGLPLLHVEQPELTGVRRLIKGTYDRGIAAVALLVLLPWLLLLGLAIRLHSHGPALFRQQRIGKNGRNFTVVKLRTMRLGAHDELADLAHLNESDGPLFKIRDDPRVTGLGAFLRRYSIDELPQLWNVLTGTMSLVGPRPPLPDEVASYLPHVGRRLLVKPGLTGLWQVSGRADLTWEQSVRLDLSYVENWTPALDLQILLRTVGAVFRRRGAY